MATQIIENKLNIKFIRITQNPVIKFPDEFAHNLH